MCVLREATAKQALKGEEEVLVFCAEDLVRLLEGLLLGLPVSVELLDVGEESSKLFVRETAPCLTEEFLAIYPRRAP